MEIKLKSRKFRVSPTLYREIRKQSRYSKQQLLIELGTQYYAYKNQKEKYKRFSKNRHKRIISIVRRKVSRRKRLALGIKVWKKYGRKITRIICKYWCRFQKKYGRYTRLIRYITGVATLVSLSTLLPEWIFVSTVMLLAIYGQNDIDRLCKCHKKSIVIV